MTMHPEENSKPAEPTAPQPPMPPPERGRNGFSESQRPDDDGPLLVLDQAGNLNRPGAA